MQARQWCLASIHAFEHIRALAGTSWSALGAHWLVPQDFWDIEDEEWLNTFNVNVMSNVRLSCHFLKPMLERNQLPRPLLCCAPLASPLPSSCTEAHCSLLGVRRRDAALHPQGRVIMIASEAGVRIIPAMMHYSVSKTAQIGLAQGLAQLAKGTRVIVNSVVVGPHGRRAWRSSSPASPKRAVRVCYWVLIRD